MLWLPKFASLFCSIVSVFCGYFLGCILVDVSVRGNLVGEMETRASAFFAVFTDVFGFLCQENNKTKHPQLLYEAKLYNILQGGST